MASKEINNVIIHPKTSKSTPLPNIIKTTSLGAQAVIHIDIKLNAAPYIKDFKAFSRYIEHPPLRNRASNETLSPCFEGIRFPKSRHIPLMLLNCMAEPDGVDPRSCDLFDGPHLHFQPGRLSLPSLDQL